MSQSSRQVVGIANFIDAPHGVHSGEDRHVIVFLRVQPSYTGIPDKRVPTF